MTAQAAKQQQQHAQSLYLKPQETACVLDDAKVTSAQADHDKITIESSWHGFYCATDRVHSNRPFLF